MEKETLEEAAERLIFKTIGGNYGIMSSYENDQVDGYYNTYEEAYLTLKLKWQAERMYSEEDMIEFAIWVFLEVGSNTGKDRTNKELFDEWFEKFKKKVK